MHIGSYDDEPATIKEMVEYAQSQGYQIAIDDVRRHHEIYLGDPRKTSADKLKTVIRYPIRNAPSGPFWGPEGAGPDIPMPVCENKYNCKQGFGLLCVI